MRVIAFVVDVMGGISSQSVEFLQKLDALRKRRMEDRYGVACLAKGKLPWQGIKKKKGNADLEAIGNVKTCTSTRPGGSRLGWVSMAAARLSVAAQH